MGIDACNFELYCRPEVFAPAIRDLCKHRVTGLKKLQLTYHVGEGFLDIANGLRAIDEAIEFFEMEKGSRLGHALALGEDPEKWYTDKYRLLIPLQEYIDTIAWLYRWVQKLLEDGGISDSEREFLQEEQNHLFESFNKYYEILFSSNSEFSVPVYEEQYSDVGVDETIEYYIKSWELRKDDPELYLADARKMYANHPSDPYDRPFDVTLYILYHYNNYLKLKGLEPVVLNFSKEENIGDLYIELIRMIQIAMQKKVDDRGIAIEAGRWLKNVSENGMRQSFIK